jgi:pilin/secretion family protein with methylation motif
VFSVLRRIDRFNCSQPFALHLNLIPRPICRRSRDAFTLMEVMVALGIFCIAGFAILGMVATTLRNARALRDQRPDAGMLAAQACLTNKLFEGSDSGDFRDLGDLYQGYRWSLEDNEVESNGLHQVDFVVRQGSGAGASETHMSILLFRPDSPPGAATGSRLGGGVRP